MVFIIPDLSNVFCLGNFCFRYAYVLLLVIPVLILLYLFIHKNMIRLLDKSEQAAYMQHKRNQRLVFFVIRSVLLLFLLIAISSPFLLETTTVKGNPRITVLVDNSTSMNLLEGGVGDYVAEQLKGEIPVTIRTIAHGDTSAIGNGILNNLERDENVLVITDGSNNDGKFLGDIMLLAASLNVTVSTVAMETIASDVGVTITGPNEAIRDTEEAFTVHVNSVGSSVPYTVEVRYDNEVVLSESASGEKSFTFTKRLAEGYHKITAELKTVGQQDYFSENNKFYKTVKVVPRPKILFVTQKSSLLAQNMGDIYDVDTTSSIPSDLSNYLAVVLNDIPASSLLPHVERLSEYVSDGNGLFVIGGQQSYDRGGYKGTLIETLLPVKVGAGEDSDKSDVHIMLIIDSSGTAVQAYDTSTRSYVMSDSLEIIKSQAVSVIESLHEDNNVGVIVSGVRDVGSIVVLWDLSKLEDDKEAMTQKIATIDRNKVGGQTVDIKFGIAKATEILRSESGGKNIILISDGRGINPRPQEDVLQAVQQASARGIKTYVVGVGASTEQATDFLSDMARTGGGTYFPVDASNKLKILFGEPDDSEDTEFSNRLVMLDTTHFITYNQSLDVVVSGYNYVIPKSSSRLLLTTNKNIPMMAVWRFGLGRVVSLATDDGGRWSGEFLNSDNSKIITRSINWAIGDLSRKKSFDVKSRDTSLGEPLTLSVVSNTVPAHSSLSFVKTDVNSYMAQYEPEQTGFLNFLGADAAVNYNEEYMNLGISDEFLNLVEQTGGEVFDKEDKEGMLAFIKEKSKRLKVSTTELRWPFIIIVLLLLLLDIAIRRMWENQNAS